MERVLNANQKVRERRNQLQHPAAEVIRETLIKEGIGRHQLTIDSDRGAAMRSQPVAQLLATLGVTRLLPRVLPLAQRGALPLWNRASDAGLLAHRLGHGSPRGTGLRAGRRSCPPPGAIRPRRSEEAYAGSGSFDQPTRKSANNPHT